MKTNPTCDYSGCGELIRDADLSLESTAKKYCTRHAEEIDEIIRGGDPAQIIKWWVKSMREEIQQVAK